MNSFKPIEKKKSATLWFWVIAAAVVVPAVYFGHDLVFKTEVPKLREADVLQTKAKDYVDLTDKQLAGLKIEKVRSVELVESRKVFGNVDLNENAAVQVFTNYQGRVGQVFVDVGDSVKKGQVLFTVDSADLAQAESTLLSAKGVFDQTSATLNRAKELYETKAISQKELQQNISDQSAAEGALKAARLTVALFGKSPAEIEQIENSRKLDSSLKILSPANGSIVTRNLQPGLFVQPGSGPAPLVVADLSSKWLIINATEAESTQLKVGQNLEVKVNALPDQTFKGQIKVVGSVVDPVTRTVTVRSEIADPTHQLRSGMYATFTVRSDQSVKSVAVPDEALVREGDGTMSVWVADTAKRMKKRTVTTGIRQNGLVQIIQGLNEGDAVASTGAIFLSNLLVVGD